MPRPEWTIEHPRRTTPFSSTRRPTKVKTSLSWSCRSVNNSGLWTYFDGSMTRRMKVMIRWGDDHPGSVGVRKLLQSLPLRDASTGGSSISSRSSSCPISLPLRPSWVSASTCATPSQDARTPYWLRHYVASLHDWRYTGKRSPDQSQRRQQARRLARRSLPGVAVVLGGLH